MTFDWMEPKVGRAVRERSAERSLQAQRREVRERARLLMHLGYSQEATATRLERALEWEHELGPGTEVVGEVGDIVDEVYTRR